MQAELTKSFQKIIDRSKRFKKTTGMGPDDTRAMDPNAMSLFEMGELKKLPIYTKLKS